uniref:translation initiation factor 1 n=1 Tax=Exochorda racemosa TaxID=133206 RepID=UPI001FCD23D3|nr:translation initiation factor 1 [Exochorda racemosa]UOA66107.1 translation initiation factor 1 [Exochorda racemosa]
MKVSPYDSTKGRIIYRLQRTDSNDWLVFSISTSFSWGYSSKLKISRNLFSSN